MLKKLILLVFISTAAFATVYSQDTAAEPPPDYVSDGCSMFPDGNYRDCCVAHDKDYYVGGSCKERRASDGRLYRCVKGKKGWYNKFVAPMMWVGVRVLGTSFLPTPYRWGFGKKKKKKSAKDTKVDKEGPEPPEPVEPQEEPPSQPPLEEPDEPSEEEPPNPNNE